MSLKSGSNGKSNTVTGSAGGSGRVIFLSTAVKDLWVCGADTGHEIIIHPRADWFWLLRFLGFGFELGWFFFLTTGNHEKRWQFRSYLISISANSKPVTDFKCQGKTFSTQTKRWNKASLCSLESVHFFKDAIKTFTGSIVFNKNTYFLQTHSLVVVFYFPQDGQKWSK